jgi:Predicted sugar kinase
LPRLWVETENTQGEIQRSLAFNDAWVERVSGQSARIEVRVNGKPRIASMVADGALLATAAGSTAYAHAVGATPVPIGTPVLILAGSNVVRPQGWKSAVLPLDAEVEFCSLDPSVRPLRGFVDGVDQGTMVRLRARMSRIAAAELAFLPNHDMAEKLAQIQFPPH